MIKKIIIAFLFILSLPLVGQVKVDSIQKTIDLIKSDTPRIKKLNSLSSLLIDSSEFQAAKLFSEQAILLCKKNNNKTEWAKALNNLGIANWYQGNLTEALNKYLEAIKIFEQIGDKKGAADSYGNIGIIYAMQENYEEALVCQLKALKIDQAVKDQQGMAYIYNNLGLIYYYQKNYIESLKNHQLALAIKEQIGDELGVAASYDNMGVLYDEQGDFEKALENYLKSFSIVEKLGNQKGMVSSYNNIGSLYVRKKNYEEAKKVMFKALQLSRKIGMKEFLQDNYKGLSGVYELQGDYKNAFNYYRLYSEMKDTLFNQENTKKQAKLEAKFDFDKKTTADSVRNYEQIKVEQLKHEQEIRQQRTYTIGGIIGFCMMILVAVVLFRSNQLKQKTNKEIALQKEVVDEKQKEIIDSITYAKRIQLALLKEEGHISKHLPEHFIFYRPKDIVSGDFYWSLEKNAINGEDKYWYLTAADCTGHGVPGAFLTMLGTSFLNEINAVSELLSPAEILEQLRSKIIKDLNQTGKIGDNKDGMDMSIIRMNLSTFELEWAGANNPLWIIRNAEAGNTIEEIKADKQPIGYSDILQPFTNYQLQLNKGDQLVMFTDGYADQFGGDKKKKFKRSQLKDLVYNNSSKSLELQKQILEKVFEEWKGDLEQIDDVCVIGVRV